MQYTKPALTFEQQADLLISRGMEGRRDSMIERLQAVNYYRLSAYSFPFRSEASDDRFRAGTTFDMVWDRYVFDRHLRLLIMDALERIEVSVRTHLSYRHAHEFGPFAYMEDAASLIDPEPARKIVDKFRNIAREAFTANQEHFVLSFKKKYAKSACLPVWMATEIMSFGNVLTFFRCCNRSIKKALGDLFKVPDDVFESWLLALNVLRNFCAHHSRVWNRVFGVKPLIPRINKHPAWHDPFSIPNDRTFAMLTICRHAVRQVAPQSSWTNRFHELLKKYPIPVFEMGFKPGWETHKIWTF